VTLATCTTSLFFWQLLKQLIMSCEGLDLVSEVVAHTLMKLPRDLFTSSNASDSFDTEHGEIPEDRQLVKNGR
jgi:hypothetical protein